MKKLLAMLLAMIMVFAIFSACGDGAVSSVSSAGDSSKAEVSESAPTAAPVSVDVAQPSAEEGSAPEGDSEQAEGFTMITTDAVCDLPLFDEDRNATLSMWVSFSDNMSTMMPNGFADNLGYKQAEETTGVHVELDEHSTTSNSEQWSLRVAASDLPNIITNVAQLWDSSYDSAIDDDIFMDLNDLVENYMPIYKSCYDQLSDDEKRQLHTDVGNFPKLISINNYPDGATEGAFIRTDYLEKIGMEIPTTYDELNEVLYAFQSELGLSEPLMAVSGIVHTSNALVSGFGVSGGFATSPMFADPYYMDNGVVKYGIIEEGYKEYMTMFAQWFADGIVSPDFISKNQNPMEFTGTIASGDVGVFFGETNMVPNYYMDGQSTDPDFEIAPLAPITKAEGEITHFANAKDHLSGRLAGISITTTEVDMEVLGTYLDYFFTYEGSLLTAMGVEGNEDGSYIFDENDNLQYSDAWKNSDLSEMNKPTYYIYSCLPMLCPETPSSYTMDIQFECADVWDSNADSTSQMPSGYSLTTEESEKYSQIYTDIRTTVDENLAKFATGVRPMDEWDSFVEDLKDMGIEDCIAIYQGAVDRFYERTV